MLLDLTGLVAGTQFRGQFESRIKGLIDEVKNMKNCVFNQLTGNCMKQLLSLARQLILSDKGVDHDDKTDT